MVRESEIVEIEVVYAAIARRRVAMLTLSSVIAVRICGLALTWTTVKMTTSGLSLT